jgi:5-methylcytosine-specific restriction endonuclease McrA
MSNILEASIVLRLNGNYQRIGWSTPQEAFTAMMGGEAGSAPYMGVQMFYEDGPDGLPDPTKMIGWQEIPWEEWIKLPVIPGYGSISTVRQKIRVPSVVVCPKFKKNIMKEQHPTPRAIRDRDGNRCVYTGVQLTNKTFSLDHVIPRSKGGRDSWENLAACHKDVNSKKGNKYNHEVGLKLRKQLVAPRPIPLSVTVKGFKHPDHYHFP